MLFQMVLVRCALVLLLTTLIRVEAANIPNLEGNPIEDIISTLTMFKNNIISMIIDGLRSQRKPSPPPPEENHPLSVPPPPPSHVAHHLPQTFNVKSPPEQYQHPHHHISSHKPNTKPNQFPIIDIDIPAAVPHVERPEAAKQIPTVDLVNLSDTKLDITTVRTDAENTSEVSEVVGLSV